MKVNALLSGICLSLTGGLLAGPSLAAPIQACHEDVCATIDTPSACLQPGQASTFNVEGVLSNASGMAFTAYQVIADAEWRYNSNHQFELISGTPIDASGFHFGATYSKQYPIVGGDATKYTFAFGSRAFGHGFYDAAVDLEFGEGGEGGSLLIDVLPGSCPNPVNLKQKGVTPVAIVGTDQIDVSQIDPAQVRLEGVAPIKAAIEDVATAFTKASVYDCTISTADGIDDLSLKFRTQELKAAIEAKLGRMPFDGEVVKLELTLGDSSSGQNACSSAFSGQDTIQALVKGKR